MSIPTSSVPGITALQSALLCHDYGAAETILAAGTPINATTVTPEQGTVLHQAAMAGDLATCQWLVERGADVAAVSLRDKETPLHLAARNGHEQVVGFLVERGAPLEAVNQGDFTPRNPAEWRSMGPTSDGRTPFLESVAGGQSKVVRQLIGLGANAQAMTRAGTTALHLAAQNDDVELLPYLVEQGVALRAVDQHGQTAMDYAVFFSASKACQWFLEQGLPESIPSNYRIIGAGATLLHAAAAWAKPDFCAYLLGRGATVLSTDERGHTPLHEAVSVGHSTDDAIACIRLLLAHGAPLEAVDQDGDTPLLASMYGNRMGSLAIPTLLLDQGANLHAQNHAGHTALHLAALFGKTKLCRLLLARGANLQARTHEQLTPLDLLRRSGVYGERRAILEQMLGMPPAPETIAPSPAPAPATPARRR